MFEEWQQLSSDSSAAQSESLLPPLKRADLNTELPGPPRVVLPKARSGPTKGDDDEPMGNDELPLPLMPKVALSPVEKTPFPPLLREIRSNSTTPSSRPSPEPPIVAKLKDLALVPRPKVQSVAVQDFDPTDFEAEDVVKLPSRQADQADHDDDEDNIKQLETIPPQTHSDIYMDSNGRRAHREPPRERQARALVLLPGTK